MQKDYRAITHGGKGIVSKGANAKAVSDEEIIAALLQHGSIKEAAAAAGISSRAIYDRMKSREFRADYMEAKNGILRRAVFLINEKLSKAIETVSSIMENPENNAAVRLQAAQTILNHAGKFAERLSRDEVSSREERKNPFEFDF